MEVKGTWNHLVTNIYSFFLWNLKEDILKEVQWGGGIIWSPADFVCLPTDKEMISL